MKRKNYTLTLISMSHGMNHVYQLLLPIIIPKIKEDYALSTTSAALIISIFSLSYALLQTPSGIVSKAVGRKKTIVLGFVITSISFLAIGFVDNILLFAMISFIAGLGGSTYHPNGIPLLSEFYIKNRGQAAGFHQTGGSLGSIIAPLVIGSLVVFLNWRLAITVISILGLGLSFILWIFLEESRQEIVEITNNKIRRNMSGLNIFKNYGQPLLLITAGVTYTVGLRGVDSLANLYFTDGRGITDFLEASFLFSMLKVAGLFSGPLCGRLSDSFGRKKTLTILISIEALSLFSLTIVPINFLIMPCLAFGFASFGLLAISDAFLADITRKEDMATIFGLHFTLSYVTQSIIPPIYGSIVDYTKSFDLGFVLLSAIVPLSIPILLKVKDKKPPQSLSLES